MASPAPAPEGGAPSGKKSAKGEKGDPARPTGSAGDTPSRSANIVENMLSVFGTMAMCLLFLATVAYAGYHAHEIRMYAIRTYGKVIHEFDPWFNYRATEYLAEHGLYEFFHWFDYKVWYPLGRPVGTTIYPGMQMTSVFIWRVLNDVVGYEMSLNDVCVYVPTWGGTCATVFLALLTRECTRSWAAGAAAAGVMAIIPAHIMRSVGGGYDNESIALTAMCMTFYLWCRALRSDPKVTDGSATRDSYVYGALTGVAYIYMAAAWGGFIFVINMVAFHAVCLFLVGRYSSKLHRAYSLFYVIGTIGAMQIPVIGWRPLKSLEQLAGLAVFLAFQVLEYCEVQRRKKKGGMGFVELLRLRVTVTLPALVALAAVVAYLYPTGYFGPLGARIRGLFLKHTRTGNPLVDSVAEHQPANEAAYKQYLHHAYHVVPYGFGLALLRLPFTDDSNSFLVAYASVAYFFANKMARLIILLGPISSALSGVAIGFALDHLLFNSIGALIAANLVPRFGPQDDPNASSPLSSSSSSPSSSSASAASDADEQKKDKGGKKKGRKRDDKDKGKQPPAGRGGPLGALAGQYASAKKAGLRLWNNPLCCVLRGVLGGYAVALSIPYGREFYQYCHQMAEGMSGPSIMFKARLRNGKEIIVDDYREAYWWLRDHTPEDSRVMAWWDYGYQITGIGNRTTIADGNTWNHEHIATLGRILSAPEKRAHRIARHIADYVLVWAGGGGDDLAKSPHMARIGNSVYHDICPRDPTCSQFGFYQGGHPTPMMRKSLLYKMTQFGYKSDVKLDPSRFTHAYTTKYGKVRIFKIERVSQKSKKWIADPANRVCDAPGSWYCSGQYPPALAKLIAKRKPFRQLEDFNVGQDKQSEKYQKEYHRRMSGGHPLSKGGDGKKKTKTKAQKRKSAGLKYMGCVGGESQLGKDKEYGGGSTGAHIGLAKSFAQEKGMKYLAIARAGVDGHSFVFNEKPAKGGRMKDSGCDVPCVDDNGFRCGCSDAACGDVDKAPGEEHLRRWVIYKVPPREKTDIAGLDDDDDSDVQDDDDDEGDGAGKAETRKKERKEKKKRRKRKTRKPKDDL